MPSLKRVAIIGAGVVGTTTALRLFEEFGDLLEITIFSEKFSPNTTGDVSAGLWGPYLLCDTPQHKICKWSKDTHDYFLKLWQSGEAAQAGICLSSMTRLTTESPEYKAFWKDIVFGFRHLDKKAIKRLNEEHRSNYTSGVHFTSFTCEPSFLLPHLYKKLMKNGVRIARKQIESFDELKAFDLIVNCTGLGAKILMKDDNDLKPMRGQVIRVKAPWIFEVLLDDSNDGNYIIPNTNSVVLGGTHQLDDYSTALSEKDTKFIYDGCVQMNASIKNAKVVKESVGLRPGRSSVRLERDTFITSDGKLLPIIHNYGHGGSGVTLSYGCAVDVCEIIRDYVKNEGFWPKSKL